MLTELVSTQRIADCIGEWTVAQVTPQHTSTAQKRIEIRGVPTFNPCEQIRITRRREIKYRPLFSGYLFACLPDQFARHIVRDAFGVWGIVDAPNQKQLRDELQQIERMLESDPTLKESRPLKPGKRAEVIRGPFEGMTGIIESNGKAGVFVLPLSIFGRVVETEIPITDLEVID